VGGAPGAEFAGETYRGSVNLGCCACPIALLVAMVAMKQEIDPANDLLSITGAALCAYRLVVPDLQGDCLKRPKLLDFIDDRCVHSDGSLLWQHHHGRSFSGG
jgi:hypothetical protein